VADDKGIGDMSKGAIVVVSLAAIVLVGLALMAVFSETLRLNTSADVNSITLPAENLSVAVGTTGQYPLLQTVTGCINASNGSQAYSSSKYTVVTGTTDGGSIVNLDGTWEGTDVNCSITYLADTTAQASADLFTTGLTVFGTFIGVIVLALVGMLIIRIFQPKKQ